MNEVIWNNPKNEIILNKVGYEKTYVPPHKKTLSFEGWQSTPIETGLSDIKQKLSEELGLTGNEANLILKDLIQSLTGWPHWNLIKTHVLDKIEQTPSNYLTTVIWALVPTLSWSLAWLDYTQNKKDTANDIIKTAIDNVEDNKILWDLVFCEEIKKEIRITAISKMTDKDLLFKVMREFGWDVEASAENRLEELFKKNRAIEK